MEYLVEMKGLCKNFGAVAALKNVNFSLKPGEVHVLLGENGAGKSTLMKMLSGAYTPTAGEIVVEGESYSKLNPALSTKLGISIIYQELSVINELSIQENIFLGRLIKKSLFGLSMLNKAEMLKKSREIIKDIGLNHEPETMVSALRISEKQMVEIAKAVAFNANIIIMDEPTSSLTEEEVKQLFEIIKKLKAAGKGIVYISHKLKEIMEIGDRVSVLKDGAYVGTKEIKDVSMNDLVTMMVGRELQDKYNSSHEAHDTGEVILEVNNLNRRDDSIKDISFKLHKGEILGFSGLVASGRTETMEAIYGAVPIKSGEVKLKGKSLKLKNTYEGLKAGIALVTENRRETGFFHNFSIKENIAVAKRLKHSKFSGLYGLINKKDEEKIAKEQVEAMQIKCASYEQLIGELSGGNQQKVILGKWLAQGECQLIIFDEPTKGIDVGTKSEIYKLMRKLCDQGIGVIVVSSEMPELLSVCDRILVYYDGKINGEYSIEEATEEKLAYSATVAQD